MDLLCGCASVCAIFAFFFIVCLFAHVGEHALRWVCVGNLWELVFPSHRAGPRDLTQVVRLFSEHLHPVSVPPGTALGAVDLKAVLSHHLSSVCSHVYVTPYPLQGFPVFPGQGGI